MQYRILTLTFAACLASSLAFADNPSDAPLLLNDGNTAAVAKEGSEGREEEGERGQASSLHPQEGRTTLTQG